MSSISTFSGSPHRVWLRYEGAQAENGLLSLYDLSRALLGFERSLAITTHFVLHNEVITQVTALKGARILAATPEKGSFKVSVLIASTSLTIYALGSLEQTNPLGHIIFSLYSLAVEEAIGQRVDYEKTLQEIYQDGVREGSEGFLLRKNLVKPKKSQIESLVEKIEPAISDMHRPVVSSETADGLSIFDDEVTAKDELPLFLNRNTYIGLHQRERLSDVVSIPAKVSSYNLNTMSGRLFSVPEGRPIPFALSNSAKSDRVFKLLLRSFSRNMLDQTSDGSLIVAHVIPTISRTGRTTKYLVVDASDPTDDVFS